MMDNDYVSGNGFRAGLWAWQDYSAMKNFLFVDGQDDDLITCTDTLPPRIVCRCLTDTVEAEWILENEATFDGILSIAGLEKHKNPSKVLSIWRKLLTPNGKLFLGMNNRLGLRYFCGDRDPYTGRSFDGIENYRRSFVGDQGKFVGQMYSKAELEKILRESGWGNFRFYSVLSDLNNPTFIFAEDFLPNEDMANRLFPTYNYPDTVFLEEEGIHASLIENGMFHQMANAYLIECSPSEDFSDVLHVTSSMERGREDSFLTIIHRFGTVEKRALYPEGRARLLQLSANLSALKKRGIPVVEGKLEDDRYVMPYITAEVGQLYLKRLILTDKEQFLREMDRFREMILRSSEVVSPDAGDGAGTVLAQGYWDMVPLNSFFMDGEFVFFDQEFCLPSCPANFVIYRILSSFYAGNPQFEQIIPIQKMFQRYGLDRRLLEWQKMDSKYMGALRKEKEQQLYYAGCRRNTEIVYTNRQRINYSDEEYQRLFVDIFQGTDRKNLVLFGSGRFADRFVAMYGKEHIPVFIVDNNEVRWGKELLGISIRSPKELMKGINAYKVLICIKNYPAVIRQLEDMGITDYAIFDPNRDYPKRELAVVSMTARKEKGDAAPKKYRVGYISGVFDLFHIGHLNMFRRAKEQCEYLIVGVETDAWVRNSKEVEPFIPFDERIEIVRSCRYVDEVVEIPEHYAGIRDAWRMYHFDVQFSGSDYINDNYWLAEKEFLEKHGATLVFFPYTEQTSSTKIKALINQRLEQSVKTE